MQREDGIFHPEFIILSIHRHFLCTYICVPMHVYRCMDIDMCVCLCVCVCTYICMPMRVYSFMDIDGVLTGYVSRVLRRWRPQPPVRPTALIVSERERERETERFIRNDIHIIEHAP